MMSFRIFLFSKNDYYHRISQRLKYPGGNFQYFIALRSYTASISFQWFMGVLYREMVFWTQWRYQKYGLKLSTLEVYCNEKRFWPACFFGCSNLLSTLTYFNIEKVWTSPWTSCISNTIILVITFAVNIQVSF